MNGYTNLLGSIVIKDFRVIVGIPTITSDRLCVSIPYTGIANPALTADLSVYEYSTNNGTTWSTMTTSSTVTNLSFTTAGASFTLVWAADTDISTLLFNNYLRIRVKAESGLYESAYATAILYFEKTIINPQTATQNVPFPEDYRGIPGSDLLEKAPKG
jgi:hypothetical protein